jgi:hypothetical protein
MLYALASTQKADGERQPEFTTGQSEFATLLKPGCSPDDTIRRLPDGNETGQGGRGSRRAGFTFEWFVTHAARIGYHHVDWRFAAEYLHGMADRAGTSMRGSFLEVAPPPRGRAFDRRDRSQPIHRTSRSSSPPASSPWDEMDFPSAWSDRPSRCRQAYASLSCDRAERDAAPSRQKHSSYLPPSASRCVNVRTYIRPPATAGVA